MAGKKPKGIPLARLLTDKGFKRNYDIEFRAALDAELHDNAAANVRRKRIDSANAKQPRGRGDDGRRWQDVVAQVVAQHPHDGPREIWPHACSAIAEWCGVEGEFGDVGTRGEFYRYELIREGKEAIVKKLSFKRFSEICPKKT